MVGESVLAGVNTNRPLRLGATQASFLDMIDYAGNDMVIPDDSVFEERRTIFGNVFSMHDVDHINTAVTAICEWDKGSDVFHAFQKHSIESKDIWMCSYNALEISLYRCPQISDVFRWVVVNKLTELHLAYARKWPPEVCDATADIDTDLLRTFRVKSSIFWSTCITILNFMFCHQLITKSDC